MRPQELLKCLNVIKENKDILSKEDILISIDTMIKTIEDCILIRGDF